MVSFPVSDAEQYLFPDESHTPKPSLLYVKTSVPLSLKAAKFVYPCHFCERAARAEKTAENALVPSRTHSVSC